METQPTPQQGNEEERRFEREPHELTPRIYVASLADYNDGRLYGQWIDAAQELDELEHAVVEMLKGSPTPGAEEYAIHDYENFGPLKINEYERLATVSRLALGILTHGPAFVHFASLAGTDDVTLNNFEEAFFGHYESVERYADQVLDDLGYVKEVDEIVPEYLKPYVTFDVERFARDIELSGDIITSEGDGGVYIFNGHL